MTKIFIISSLLFGLSFSALARHPDRFRSNNRFRAPVWVCLSYNFSNGKLYTAKGIRRNQARLRSIRKCRRSFYGSNLDDFFVPVGRSRICSRPKCFRWNRLRSAPFN